MVFCNIEANKETVENLSHNPYFNRWFSAIYIRDGAEEYIIQVTILILIDGFLQFKQQKSKLRGRKRSQSLF